MKQYVSQSTTPSCHLSLNSVQKHQNTSEEHHSKAKKTNRTQVFLLRKADQLQQFQLPSHSYQQIQIKSLLKEGYVQNSDNHNYILLDLTSLLNKQQWNIIVDERFKVLKPSSIQNVQEQLTSLSEAYRRSVGYCQLLLNTLEKTQKSQQKLLEENYNLKEEVSKLRQEVSMLQESKDSLESDLLQEQREAIMEKERWKEQNCRLKKEVHSLKKTHRQEKQRSKRVAQLYAQQQLKHQAFLKQREKHQQWEVQTTKSQIFQQHSHLDYSLSSRGNATSAGQSNLFRTFDPQPEDHIMASIDLSKKYECSLHSQNTHQLLSSSC